jgi:RsiW-degrading membrane proteinase PrsW (M82 family)
VLCGLLGCLIALVLITDGSGDNLALLGGIIGYSLAPVVGGGFGLWYGILGIMRRPSPRFQLPPAWIMLGLTVLAIGGGLAVWMINLSLGRAPGAAFDVLPLALLAGALPALAILAFTTQRLHDPSTRRHVWMSLIYGATLAPLIAVIVELILTLIIVFALGLTGSDAQAVLTNQGAGAPTGAVALAMFLVLSVVAPVVEEGVKPLGALLAIRRLRVPGEAFLVGLAAGIGFDIFETIGYIGMGQADWISVAIERVGAGLLHGVGAGMGALGWYYLINGKGVRLRWLRAIGCFAYALIQHGTFNAFSLIGLLLPPSLNQWLGEPFKLGTLPLQRMDVVFLVIYALILTVLIIMTSLLPRAKGMPASPQPPQPQWPAGYPYSPYGPYAYPAIPWGYGLTQPPAAQAPQAAPGGAQ